MDKLMNESFGDFFRRLRKSKGFKWQKDLAEASGVSQTTISRIEDNTQKPQPETLEILAKTLNYSYHELMVMSGNWGANELEEFNNIEQSVVKETPSQYITEKEFSAELETFKQFKKLAEEHDIDLSEAFDILKQTLEMFERTRRK